jgi:hypothetical protein
MSKWKLKSGLRHQTMYFITPDIKSEGLKLLHIHSSLLKTDDRDFVIKILQLQEITEKQKYYLKSLLPITSKFYKTLLFSDKKSVGVDKWSKVKHSKPKHKVSVSKVKGC